MSFPYYYILGNTSTRHPTINPIMPTFEIGYIEEIEKFINSLKKMAEKQGALINAINRELIKNGFPGGLEEYLHIRKYGNAAKNDTGIDIITSDFIQRYQKGEAEIVDKVEKLNIVEKQYRDEREKLLKVLSSIKLQKDLGSKDYLAYLKNLLEVISESQGKLQGYQQEYNNLQRTFLKTNGMPENLKQILEDFSNSMKNLNKAYQKQETFSISITSAKKNNTSDDEIGMFNIKNKSKSENNEKLLKIANLLKQALQDNGSKQWKYVSIKNRTLASDFSNLSARIKLIYASIEKQFTILSQQKRRLKQKDINQIKEAITTLITNFTNGSGNLETEIVLSGNSNKEAFMGFAEEDMNNFMWFQYVASIEDDNLRERIMETVKPMASAGKKSTRESHMTLKVKIDMKAAQRLYNQRKKLENKEWEKLTDKERLEWIETLPKSVSKTLYNYTKKIDSTTGKIDTHVKIGNYTIAFSDKLYENSSHLSIVNNSSVLNTLDLIYNNNKTLQNNFISLLFSLPSTSDTNSDVDSNQVKQYLKLMLMSNVSTIMFDMENYLKYFEQDNNTTLFILDNGRTYIPLSTTLKQFLNIWENFENFIRQDTSVNSFLDIKINYEKLNNKNNVEQNKNRFYNQASRHGNIDEAWSLMSTYALNSIILNINFNISNLFK